ncbi:MAG: CcmD family protein [Calditrichaeota bacterium]|nr:MAG: CcmD family protein [Calditrichota bacterium]
MNSVLLAQQVGDSLTQAATAASKASPSDIYIVLTVTVIVWLGIFFYLVNLNKKVNQLKNAE